MTFSSDWAESTLPVMPMTTMAPIASRVKLRSMTLKEEQGDAHRWGPRNYLCTDCNQNFALMASLKRHRVYECNNHRESSPPGRDKKRRKKKHVCPNCNRVYAVFTSLWRHRNYECGVEPKFVCPICKFRFSQKSNLDRHVRTKH